MANNENKEYNLYEFLNIEEIKGEENADEYINELEKFLDDIWKRRDKYDSFYTNDDDVDNGSQRILSLLRHNRIKQRNYVGVIQFKGKTFNLLPKIFYDDNKDNNKENNVNEPTLKTINCNILWWLSYTTRIRFPKNITSISKLENHSFLEVMIWLFATYTKETLSNNLFQNYFEVENETSYVKGQLMFNEYVRDYLGRAKWDKVYCRYDSFELDNHFNRIIKYVATMLSNSTQVNETKRCLHDIIFLLSEVEDDSFTVEDCRKVKLNHFQNEFETILEYCRLFLVNSVSINYKDKLELFAFLLPMERLFEEFVFGFIEKEMNGEMKIEKQTSGIDLTENNGYKLKPDLKIEYNGRKLLADTKYKIVFERDTKLSQGDLYQMVSYAIRYKCQDIILFYPETGKKFDLTKLEIKDELSGKIINIYPCVLPVKIEKYDSEKSFVKNFVYRVIELKSEIKDALEKGAVNKENGEGAVVK